MTTNERWIKIEGPQLQELKTRRAAGSTERDAVKEILNFAEVQNFVVISAGTASAPADGLWIKTFDIEDETEDAQADPTPTKGADQMTRQTETTAHLTAARAARDTAAAAAIAATTAPDADAAWEAARIAHAAAKAADHHAWAVHNHEDPTTRIDAAALATDAHAAAKIALDAAKDAHAHDGDDPDHDLVTEDTYTATLDALDTEEHTDALIRHLTYTLVEMTADYRERGLYHAEKTAAHAAARRWFAATFTTTEAAAATAAALTYYIDPATLAEIAVETADEPARAAALDELTRHDSPYETRRLLTHAAAEAHSRGRLDADPAELAEQYPSLTPIRADDDTNDPPLNWITTHAPDTAADRQIWRDDAAAAILRTFLAAHDPHNDTDGQMMIDGKKFRFTLPASNRQIPIHLYAGQLNQIPTATIHAEHMTAAAALIAQLAQPA